MHRISIIMIVQHRVSSQMEKRKKMRVSKNKIFCEKKLTASELSPKNCCAKDDPKIDERNHHGLSHCVQTLILLHRFFSTKLAIWKSHCSTLVSSYQINPLLVCNFWSLCRYMFGITSFISRSPHQTQSINTKLIDALTLLLLFFLTYYHLLISTIRQSLLWFWYKHKLTLLFLSIIIQNPQNVANLESFAAVFEDHVGVLQKYFQWY